MSIVGTRPPLISETNLYELHHRVRLAIKPGITGMWQVSGRSDITDFEEVVRLDKEYISNWNIGLDIKILLRDLSKHQIDALEQWCRRLIDDIFKQNYGGFYIDAEVNPGQPLIKSSIKRTIEERRKQDPTRFPRWIDGIVMEDLEYFICRDDLYSKYFRKIFEVQNFQMLRMK